jgi:hypothetical protein
MTLNKWVWALAMAVALLVICAIMFSSFQGLGL